MKQLASTVVTCVFALFVAAPAVAQVQRGAIYGTVHDATGGVLPGVVLQLTSSLSATHEITTGTRGEFRFSELDPGRYTVSATLEGFAPLVRHDIDVSVGAALEIRIEMVVAGVIETVGVTAASPTLDVQRQGNVTSFDRTVLNGIPSPRDPWALMQHLPGVSVARPNVGGSESTNQAQFAARGDSGANTMWNIDGVTITDMTATGGSTTYYDFNAFEEVQFTTGSLDPRQHTGALGVNLVTKRGGNALRGSGRVFFSGDKLQVENISQELRAAGLSGNRIRQLAEYGADLGGPLKADRLWFWAAASRTDVRQLAINGFPDNSIINTAAARSDAQLGAITRASLLFHRAEKLKDGRAAGVDRPPETTWGQSGPTNIYKAEVSRVLGQDLFVSSKFAYVDSGFALTPRSGLNAQAYRDFAAQVWHGGFLFSASDRTQRQVQVDGEWMRGGHEVKFGAHYRSTTSHETSGWPGDGTFTIVNAERLGLPSGIGFANLTRRAQQSSGTDAISAYVGDVAILGRWRLNLGLRFDRQRGRNHASQAPANGLAPSILPALAYDGGPPVVWSDLSPRIGATYRVSDDTIVRASYARFSTQLPWTVFGFDNAAQTGTIQYFFRDDNGDHLAQPSELIGPTGSVTAVDAANPAAPYSPNRIDPDVTSPRTDVFTGAVEHHITRSFLASVTVGHGYVSNAIWSPFIGLTSDDFVEYAPANVSIPTAVYRLAPGRVLPRGNGLVLSNRDGYHQRSWNLDVAGTRRLADRWMFRGVLTLQQQREYFDDRARAIQDPTARFDPFQPVASGLIDGGIAVSLLPGSEFVIHTKWKYSLAGVYELPGGFSVAGTLYGRQGNPVVEIYSVNRPDGLGITGVMLDADLDATRYPAVHLLDLRLQKTLGIGRARAVFTLDLFNTLNNATVLRRFREATAQSFRRPQEIVAPRLLRLGLQLDF